MSFYVKLGEKKTVLEKIILVLEMFLILQYNKGYNSLIVKYHHYTLVKASHYSRYCLQVSFSREQQKYAKMLAIVVHENMKFGEHTLNNTFKHKISDEILANCGPYFTALQYINNLETKRSYKRTVYVKTLNYF